MITLDYLPNREEIKLYQDHDMICINTDTMVLGEFLEVYRFDTVLDIGTNLYPVDKYKPNVENLKLLKSINNDIPKFKTDHQYLNSALNCISTLTRDNPYNGQEALNCGLFQSLNSEVSKLIKEGPEKYDQKNEGDEPNGYLKTCFKTPTPFLKYLNI